MNRHTIARLAGWTLVLLVLVSCTLNANFSPTANFPTPLPITPFPATTEPTNSLPTVQLTASSAATEVPQPTDVPQATAVPATQTPAPTTAATAVPVPAGTRLSMGKGRTVVYVSSSVAAGGSKASLVGAGAGQFMMVNISSANQSLYLQIQAPDGSTLVSPADQKIYWQGTLPADGDYVVAVVSTNGAGDFEMSVTIPARVVFASGAITTSVNATIGARDITTFLMRALQGQNLSVKIISTVGDVYLTIYGLQDGNPYVRSVTGQTSYSFTLPSTQDYVIQCVNTGDKSEDLIVSFAAQ